MKNIITFIVAVFVLNTANANMPFMGYYKTIDDETKNAKSVVQLYQCDGEELCGKIVALYNAEGTEIIETEKNATKIADKVDGKPKMIGLKMLWDMEWDTDDNRYEDGDIMDPKTGKEYSAVIWQEAEDVANNTLRVRGKIGPFGRTQIWHKTTF